MARNIVIEKLDGTPIEKRRVEIVERKGKGHPDTLVDGIMEGVSCALCKEYIREFGKILHHNVDKGLICGGATNVCFGGGEFINPLYIVLNGRAISEAKGKKIPVSTLALKAAKEHLKKNTRFLNLEEDVEFDARISTGSPDLEDVFARTHKIPLANDTSFGVGFAPLSATERLALETEKMLNSPECKEKMPYVGEDIKVMALRENSAIKLTVAVAFVSRFVRDLDDYIKKKEHVRIEVQKLAEKLTHHDVEVHVNTADDYKRNSVYITLTGLSCEMGDDGSVGRGNRVSGLITPFRPMTLEAAAGKNPVNHVGKVYSVLAFEIARDIVRELPQIKECNVSLLSEIGTPIDQPKNADVRVVLEDGEAMARVHGKIHYIVDDRLANVTRVTEKIVNGEVCVY
ncbi:MAG: methionine adenosyltransferase [Candidatus Micrarchaeota archaeon]